MKGFITYPTYRTSNNESRVHLYGRLDNGESFLTISRFEPYFFIREKDSAKAKATKAEYAYRMEKSAFKNFDEDILSKIILDVPQNVPGLRKGFEEQGIPCYEADIRFVYRFMIDHGIKGAMDIEGKFRKGEQVTRIYEDPVLSPSSFKPRLNVISIDIETDMKASEVYAIALYGDSIKKVLVVSDKKIRNGESFKSEKEMLLAFKKEIISLDPDILTGWNFVDFDLTVLKRRFDFHRIPFTIGRDDSPLKIKHKESFFTDSSVDLPGRAVLDGIHLMKMSFIKLDDYKLQTAAKTFLNESKAESFEDTNKGKEIERIFREETQRLADYNLKDAELVFRILEKKGLIDLAIQRSLLTGMQIDRVKASIASLDNLYLSETGKRGYVCNTSDYNETEARIKGGYVRESMPGIYSNIVVLDFKSLYPSIIRTFNIDPLSYVPPEREKNYKKSELITAPNKACFKSEDGILPLLIQRLWAQRDDAKKRGNKEESNAVKITMNSFFGVLANPMCRFYNLNIANAITFFGQEIVKKTADIVDKKGIRVIYGDTDSIFVETKSDNIAKAEEVGRELQSEINAYWASYVEKEFRRKCFLEIQFEKAFIKFIMPKVRAGERGSKKRYAGMVVKSGKESIDFTGLEFVRRDWTELAKKFQLELLDRVFHDKEIVSYVNEFTLNLKNGRYDDLIVYKKALRKDIGSYTKTTPPHVKAARLMGEIKSDIIAYVMTKKGPEPVGSVKSPIDYEHYIEKQIKPIADSILVFYDSKFDDVMKGSKQRTLFSFG